MVSIPVKMRISAEGTFTLCAPPEFRDKFVEGFLILDSERAPSSTSQTEGSWQDRVMALAGSITDETFERGPQGEYEVREEL
jgi:hypothetical protein